MNYAQIIWQAWQIIKRTRILWVVGLINFIQYLINFRNTNNLVLGCISFLYVLLILSIIVLFSPFASILSAEKAFQGEKPQFKEIWAEFKSMLMLGRQLLFYLAFIIPGGLIFLCSLLSVAIAINIMKIDIPDTNARFFLASFFSRLFFDGFLYFSLYGLFIHKMDVIKSLKHGIGLFSMNWFKCFVLSLFLKVPIILTYLIIWLILYLPKTPSITTAFFRVLATFPGNIWIAAISSFIFLLSIVSFLLAYHQFIQEFDYETLKPVLSKT